MATKVKAKPDGYHTATPYLIVNNAAAAIDFYKRAFGATEMMRMDMPGGRIGHAEIKIGDSPIMLADEFPEMNARGPHAIGGSPVSIMLYVEDVDAVAKQAEAAGAKITRPIEDQFYGDRTGGLEDPFGHHWHIATHKEDVPEDEMARRHEKLLKEKGMA
jgi:PhnB protein